VADTGTRQRLQLALREAVRARDTVATSALRSALAAIDNASAVLAAPAPAAGTGGPHFVAPAPAAGTGGPYFAAPAPGAGSGGPHFAGAVAGLGAGEAQRRRLTEAEAEQIVWAEVTDRQAAARDYDRTGHAAARDYDRTGHADQAGRLRREAQVLLSVIAAAGH
jgi:uncharacterized protein